MTQATLLKQCIDLEMEESRRKPTNVEAEGHTALCGVERLAINPSQLQERWQH
jgi:hypothetical protein